MKSFTGIEYLAIDLANQFGLDKLCFEDRIQWVQDNFSKLESLVDQADEDPIQYIKAVQSLRKAVAGEEVGHIVYLDACCSGMQIMSALAGCHKGARITGLVDPDTRMDAYKFITITMNNILKQKGLGNIEVERKDAKDAIMPCIYGSTAKPKEYFGEGVVLESFNEACLTEATGCFEMLNILRKTWQRGAMQHNWQLPDGFVAQIKVFQKVETRVKIVELFNYNMTIQTKVHQGTDYGVSNVANSIHSIDAFVLRELVRRCNYNKPMMTKVYHIIKDHMAKPKAKPLVADEALNYYQNLASKHGTVSVVVLPYINEVNVGQLHPMYLKDLLAILEQMLTYAPFQVTTVHDAFGCLANNCDTVRYWYKELLAELADSSVIEFIIQQITGNYQYKYRKHSENLANIIRQSNYALS